MPIKTAIWDIETDGLKDKLTRVHCLHIRDMERGKTYRFRQNDEENTIEDGVAMLEEAEILVAHNGLDFDVPVLEMLYDFNPVGRHYSCSFGMVYKGFYSGKAFIELTIRQIMICMSK